MNRAWLFSKNIDLIALFLPVWLTWLACFLVSDDLLNAEVPVWFWVVFIIGIDVSHVWSTLFRTYFDPQEFRLHRRLLILTPLVCMAIAAIVATNSVSLFWTLMAYLALYHFIKQQYGFMQLYRARLGFFKLHKVISDKFVIYWSMLYPVLYWHLNTKRNFEWFVEGDFYNLRMLLNHVPFWDEQFHLIFTNACNVIYFAILIFWCIEDYLVHKRRATSFPIGKWLWVWTTAGNWYIGIVYFNSDFAFSLTNVVAHGIPYLVLIFFYIEKKKQLNSVPLTTIKVTGHIVWMSLIVLILAFGEEYIWDMLIYRDNMHFFESILRYPMNALDDPVFIGFALAFLSVPQVTHYVLDGFIWKANARNPYVRKTLLH